MHLTRINAQPSLIQTTPISKHVLTYSEVAVLQVVEASIVPPCHKMYTRKLIRLALVYLLAFLGVANLLMFSNHQTNPKSILLELANGREESLDLPTHCHHKVSAKTACLRTVTSALECHQEHNPHLVSHPDCTMTSPDRTPPVKRSHHRPRCMQDLQVCTHQAHRHSHKSTILKSEHRISGQLPDHRPR